jgi:TatD DNase family protein
MQRRSIASVAILVGENLQLLIDSHAHLDSPRYNSDRREMLHRSAAAGVGAVLAIGIGEGPAEMHRALEICREFNGKPGIPRLFSSAGIYPHTTPDADAAAFAKLDRLLAEPEVIACGEIGFDYYHQGAPHDVQRAGLILQLEIAAARSRPILIHCRGSNESADAWNDLFAVLDEHWRSTGLRGVMHCFGGGWEQARRSLDLGFLRDVAARTPLDRMLVETDAPWLAPAALRGQRNEPAMMTRTAETLAQAKGITPAEIATATTANFARLFALGPDLAPMQIA